MKILGFLLLTGVLGTNSMALDSEISRLERRIEALEQNKIEHCELEFKHYSTSLIDCPKKTFAYSTRLIGDNGPIQLRCGYYKLNCFRRNEHGELQSEPIELRIK